MATEQDVTVVDDPSPSDQPRVLVHGLGGFLDAGAAPSAATDHLVEVLDTRLLATFSSDHFVDYRARRPVMTFVRDHYESLTMPEVSIRELTDDLGQPFLLMTGPEPDFAWNRFIAAVSHLVQRWDVEKVVGLGAIPWPAPHTRPLDVSAHSTDPQVVAHYRKWVDALQIPGHLPGALELRLGEAGVLAFGYAVHVPQYLAQFRYPRASIRLLDALVDGTGLAISTEALRAQADNADEEISSYLEGSPELREMVAALEVRYDAIHASGAPEWDSENLPSGEEIAAALQSYLADQAGPGAGAPEDTR